MAATDKTLNGPSQGHHSNNFRHIGSVLNICHFNAEGLSRSKCECIGKVLHNNGVDVIALQETHVEDIENSTRGLIPGYRLIDAIGHRAYGVATYVKNDIDDVKVTYKSCIGNIFVLAVKVSEITIVNIYKPPNIQWPDPALPTFEHPVLFVGDFNSHHSQWGYSSNDRNGIALSEWADNNNLSLVFDAKDKSTFFSARWRRGYNPDLCFSSCDQTSRPMPVGRKVLGAFPHSQHRPVAISVGISIPLIRSFPRARWNFQKANWEGFTTSLEKCIRFISPSVRNYNKFTKLVLSSAKKCIPRGFRKEYIPGWSKECDDLYTEFTNTGDSATADRLLQSLDEGRKSKWAKTVEELNFTRSSRKAWALLRKLSSGKLLNERTVTHPHPRDVAKRIVSLSKACRQLSDKKIKYKVNEMKRSHQAPLEVSKPFTPEELDVAISTLQTGKAAGLDDIFPEFLKHAGVNVRRWLLTLYNIILSSGELPVAFKRSKVIAVLKPGKEPEKAESYRPIALLSVCHKLLERLLYNRISPILNASIPVEQAGFRPGRSCCDQVLSLTSFIEKGFDQQLKTSAAFIDLSAAYDTVWRTGLLFKFYALIPCRSLLQLLDNMLSNRLIKVYLGRQESSFRHLNDGLPQGSVLAPLLFNIYTADIPLTESRKFIYADDIALAIQHKNLKITEDILTSDLATLEEYFRAWKLRPNPTKTEVACFHLNNKLANHKLNVSFNGVPLHHNERPQYLGVTLDRSLTFKSHLKKTAAKVRTRANLVQHLAGTSWGANANVLRISTLSLVFSTAEYCAPVWLNSAHVSDLDTQLNRAMRTISGTLMATPLPWLPVLCNITPPEIRRRDALLREYNKILSAPSLPILQDLPPVRSRLRSRKPPLQLARTLQLSNFSAKTSWIESWAEFEGRNSTLVPDPTTPLGGMDLPRREWVALNRFRTDVGRCNYWKARWGQVFQQTCDCGADYQTMNHIVNDCPLRAFSGGLAGLNEVSAASINWLSGLDLNV